MAQTETSNRFSITISLSTINWTQMYTFLCSVLVGGVAVLGSHVLREMWPDFGIRSIPNKTSHLESSESLCNQGNCIGNVFNRGREGSGVIIEEIPNDDEQETAVSAIVAKHDVAIDDPKTCSGVIIEEIPDDGEQETAVSAIVAKHNVAIDDPNTLESLKAARDSSYMEYLKMKQTAEETIGNDQDANVGCILYDEICDDEEIPDRRLYAQLARHMKAAGLWSEGENFESQVERVRVQFEYDRGSFHVDRGAEILAEIDKLNQDVKDAEQKYLALDRQLSIATGDYGDVD